MASQWYSLVSEKLFLARTLLADVSARDAAPQREAATQGAIELALRSRQLLLTMIARFYQHKGAAPSDLEALAGLVGEDAPDLAELQTLAARPDSWWNQLEQLHRAQMNPPGQKKTVAGDNIITIAAEQGPDRSPDSLTAMLTAMKHFTDTLEERHSEW